MATYTLDQTVSQGDLILAFNSTEPAHMLLVKHTLDANNIHLSASSIIVNEIGMCIPGREGSWMLSGPDVYYIQPNEGSRPSPPLSTEMTLNDFLFPLTTINLEESGESRFRDVWVIVNPHGRDVLKYYFRYRCPECFGRGWICPGCGGVSSRWPAIYGGCGVDQSCLVCMGYDFALDDKYRLRNLQDMQCYQLSDKSDDPYHSTEESQVLFEEALERHRLRYELITSRTKEMGLTPLSAGQLQSMEEKFKMNWFE